MLWEVDVRLKDAAGDHAARAVVSGARALGIGNCTQAVTASGWLVEGSLARADVERLAAAHEILVFTSADAFEFLTGRFAAGHPRIRVVEIAGIAVVAPVHGGGVVRHHLGCLARSAGSSSSHVLSIVVISRASGDRMVRSRQAASRGSRRDPVVIRMSRDPNELSAPGRVCLNAIRCQRPRTTTTRRGRR